MAARVGAVLAVLLLTGGVAACSGGGSGGGGDSSAVLDAKQAGRAAAGVPLDAAEVGDAPPAASDGAPGGANRTTIRTRAVISTGQVAVTNEDLGEAREEVDRLLLGFGGSIDSEQTSHDDDGNIERSTVVLRVPVAKFKAAMEALGKLGRMKTSDSTSKDVTTEVIDVDERVQTLQNSLDRLQRFQSRSENIDDLIRFEDQITQRESQLQSLQAQQSYLADQTAMSTITLYLSVPDKYVAPPDALEDAGFLTGLKSGWNALKDFVVVALTVFGAALPFVVALALVGVPTWLLVRAVVRRRTENPQPPAPTPADAA